MFNQHKYVNDLLHKIGLIDSHSMPTPMTGDFLSKVISCKDDFPCPSADMYRFTIGALQHICVTHPDFALVVNKFSLVV